MLLETERLILRPWEDGDAESLFEYARDGRVGPIAGWPTHTSVENSREVIRNILSVPETYAVCLKEDNRAIGSIGLMIGKSAHTGLPESEGEIGYWIGVPFWGRGLIPEATRALIRHAFVDLHLKTLWCGYFDGNSKSRRVQEKCGFVYHHTDRDVYWSAMDEIRTEHITQLTVEKWKAAFTLRRLAEKERPAALSLAWRVFLRYEAPDYSPEGTEEFRRCLHDEAYLAGIEYFGAFDGDALIGTVGIRRDRCHICFFFVDEKYHRLGVGTGLFERVKTEYPGQTITLNSSPYGLPFYRSLGFQAADGEQTVNGIRFTPMLREDGISGRRIVRLRERRDLKEKAAEWFSSKWNIPTAAYLDSMEESFHAVVPSWYLCLAGDRIIAGMGVIENDFHNRPDLTPNVCAVFTEPEYRNQGVCGELLRFVCEDMKQSGIDTLYLLTDHTGFYERYGWEYLCPAQGDGEEKLSRMYLHRT